MFLAKRSSWSSKNIPLLLKLDSGRNSSPFLISIESKRARIYCLLALGQSQFLFPFSKLLRVETWKVRIWWQPERFGEIKTKVTKFWLLHPVSVLNTLFLTFPSDYISHFECDQQMDFAKCQLLSFFFFKKKIGTFKSPSTVSRNWRLISEKMSIVYLYPPAVHCLLGQVGL